MNLEIQITEIKALVLQNDAMTNIRMCFSGTSIRVTPYIILLFANLLRNT